MCGINYCPFDHVTFLVLWFVSHVSYECLKIKFIFYLKKKNAIKIPEIQRTFLGESVVLRYTL